MSTKNHSSEPLVSIVIPTYNHATFLSAALDSVRKQTYKKFEVIIVDNESTDNTNSVISDFSDLNIKKVNVKNDGVIAKSRNLGIDMAKGEWIAFLDSDDTWYPEKLKCCLNEISNREYDVCSCNELVVSGGKVNGRVIKYGPYIENFYVTLLIDGNRLSTSASMVRREFLETNNIKFREDKNFATAEDYDFWLLLAHAGAKFHFVNCVLGTYTIHDANNSRRIDLHINNIRNVLFDHVDRYRVSDHERKIMRGKINSRLCFMKARYYATEDNLIAALGLTVRGIVFAPLFGMYWLFRRTSR